MKLLKKSLFIAVLMLAVLLSVSALAEETALNTVKVYFSPCDTPTIVENNVVFNLYDETQEITAQMRSVC